jgi:hypothetical protein
MYASVHPLTRCALTLLLGAGHQDWIKSGFTTAVRGG